jgi:ElaB/YqjD/DUF883 family membrane-anchored ribosome-binding protein
MAITMPWNDTKQANGWSTQLDDVKKQLGQQLDQLSKVAADVGREAAAQAASAKTQAASATSDAGATAADAARDLGNQAAKASQDVGAQAATFAKSLPVAGAALLAQAMKGAQQLGGELRKVRITREPPAQRGPDVRSGVALLAGVGGGLALMFFFDPDEGRRRRALLRDQLTKWTRIGRRTAEGTAKDFRNRTVGVMHEARKAVASRTGETDEMTKLASSTNGYGARETPDYEQSPFTEPQPSQVG